MAASASRRRRRDAGRRAPIILLLFAIALFAAAAVGGTPCLNISSNDAVPKLRQSNLWTLYHWSRGDFGSDEGGEASGPHTAQPCGTKRPRATDDGAVPSFLLLLFLAPAARMLLPSWSQGAWLLWRICIGRSPTLVDASTLATSITDCLRDFTIHVVMKLHRLLFSPWSFAVVEPWAKACVVAFWLPLKMALIGSLVIAMWLPHWKTAARCHHGTGCATKEHKKLSIAVHQLVSPVLLPYAYQLIQGLLRVLSYTWSYLVTALLVYLTFYLACWICMNVAMLDEYGYKEIPNCHHR